MKKKQKNKFNVELGFRVRQIRSLNKWSQEVLGERLGVSTPTMQRYEAGEIPLTAEAIGKCAASLSTPVGFFYGETDQHPAATNTNRTGLLLAAEIMELPDNDGRKHLYHFIRSLNRAWQEKDAA
ncbi:helix-turn-helix domain-containing protein [Pararhizobium sp. IMCC21322]|uniref:helix-turn-helix domain-containing protein n=1 Tax=Pararhizobium sp. IMCC21322 TaxID=3067903 RepID=UPI0027414D07|nr:helix-turn-helix transcriptional regulator [Pararhizobium sp. IMCC21322]